METDPEVPIARGAEMTDSETDILVKGQRTEAFGGITRGNRATASVDSQKEGGTRSRKERRSKGSERF